MTRNLRWLAVLGGVAVPAVAVACWPMWRGPVYCPPMYAMPACPPPMYAPPVYIYPAAPGYALPPPRVEAGPKIAPRSAAPAPEMGTNSPTRTHPLATPTHPPTVESIRPAGGSDNGMSPMIPAAMPPKKADAATTGTEPGTIPNFPKVEIPKSLGPLPKLDVPTEPDFRPIPAPKGEGAKSPTPAHPEKPALSEVKVPVPGTAVPSPAPAGPDPLLPSFDLPLPAPKMPDMLPSLTLPVPDAPVAPAAPPKSSTSRYSPLTSDGKHEMDVNVYPVSSAEKLTTGYRTVGFYNHTTRDLNLTIEGRAVKLPAKTYLYAKLAASFTWSQSDKPTMRETVPAGSSGLDVVFRSGE